MGQSLYQTEEDILNEIRFLDKIEGRFNCRGVKVHHNLQFDMLLTRSEKTLTYPGSIKAVDVVVAVAELKCRNVKHNSYPTCVIGEHKVRTALEWTRRFLRLDTSEPIPFIFFVRYLDLDRYTSIVLLDKYKREKFVAANHADDPTDTEYVLHIPCEEFRTF